MNRAASDQPSFDLASAPPRVLVVEPNRSYLQVLARRIGEGGFRIATADSAHSAIAELHRMPVDLVVAELRMKGAGGVELVRMMRDDPSHGCIPVFLITGKSDSEGAVQGYRSGADAVIAKPFHFEVLIARIARELERARSLKKLRQDKAALDARVVSRAIEIGELRAQWKRSEAERLRLESLVRSDAA